MDKSLGGGNPIFNRDCQGEGEGGGTKQSPSHPEINPAKARAYQADDFVKVEEHSHVSLSTADEAKTIPQCCYHTL